MKTNSNFKGDRRSGNKRFQSQNDRPGNERQERGARKSTSGKRPARVYKKKEAPVPKPGLRLNQYLAKAGICSRREADTLIAQGLVKVNGKVVTELGTRITDTDDVRFEGRKLNPERKVYILLNKPKDTVTTMRDPHAKKTVLDLVKNACKERVYPVGRLDRNTTGVLLLTNDGELSAKLTHPKYNHKKIYHIYLNKAVTKADLVRLAEGFDLEDGFIKADKVSYVDTEDKSQIGMEIHSGRNRIVRRMMEQLGYDVKKLDRVYFAGLTKKNVPRGKWRFLSESEVVMLKMN